MPTNKPQRPRKAAPDVPAWIKESWETANAKDRETLTMRDVDAMIEGTRAGKRPKNYKPVTLSITLTKGQADWLKRRSAELHCSIEELIGNAVSAYRRDRPSLDEDLEYFTKAIAQSTDQLKTGRYET